MGAVGRLGLEHGPWGIGDPAVVAVAGEQPALPVRDGFGVEAPDLAHDQRAADVVALVAGRERGECHLGDFGVRNQVLFVFVPDRIRVVDRGLCRLLDPRDRFNDNGVHPCGDREPGPSAAGRGDDVVSVVRAFGAHGDQPAPATRLGVVDVDVMCSCT